MPIFPRYDGPPLLEQAVSVENLTAAWRRVRSNIQVARRHRSAGVDLVTLRDFEADWSAQMARLADELRSGSYRPLPARTVRIPKASGGERAIAVLTIRDRVAQRAVQQVLQPLFEPLFLDCSYGCRVFVGVPDALARVARYADQGLTWAVDADIATYFDTIDRRILLALLRQRIDEAPLLQLIAQWLQVGVLHESETAPLSDGPAGAAALLQRGMDLVRRGVGAELPPQPEYVNLHDPYAAGAWETGGPPALSPVLGAQHPLVTAVSLAQPLIQGVRYVAPHLRRIGTQRLLIGGAVAAGAVALGELAMRAHAAGAARGTPQGGALSPLLANIYLHPFDLAVTGAGLRMVRYMDDLVVMCADQNEAGRALELICRQLAQLRLTLNAEKSRIVDYSQGLEFLGQALAPRRSSPQPAEAFRSFEEAERALRTTSRRVGERVRQGAEQVTQRLRRKE